MTTNEDAHDGAVAGGSVPLTHEEPHPPTSGQQRKFGLSDFLALEANRPVINKFLKFATALAFVPIAMLYIVQWTLRILLNAKSAAQQTASLVVAVLCVLGIMGLYAHQAYLEEVRDYNALSEEEKKEQDAVYATKKTK